MFIIAQSIQYIWPLIFLFFVAAIAAKLNYFRSNGSYVLQDFLHHYSVPCMAFLILSKLSLVGLMAHADLLWMYLMLTLFMLLMMRLAFGGLGYGAVKSKVLAEMSTIPDVTVVAVLIVMSLPNSDTLMPLVGVALIAQVLIHIMVLLPVAVITNKNMQRSNKSVSVMSPFVVAALLGFVFSATALPLPEPAHKVLHAISLTLPAFGIFSYGLLIDFKHVYKMRYVEWFVVAVKTILMPLLAYLFSIVQGLDATSQLVLVILAHCPASRYLIRMAHQNDNSLELEVETVYSVSFLLSMVGLCCSIYIIGVPNL